MFAKLISPGAAGFGIEGACYGGSTPAGGGKCAKGYSPIWPGACRSGIFPLIPP